MYLASVAAAALVLGSLATGQTQARTPTQTAIAFYQALKEKKYVEGFRMSVYRDAIQGLSPVEIEDLAGDFAQTFAEIPEKIETRGEQITGESATVFLKFDGVEMLQQVSLIRVGPEWLVGDKESLEVVKSQGRKFFFNARMTVNETETGEVLSRIVDSQSLYAQTFGGKRASLEELVKLGALPQDLQDGEANGYRVALTVSADLKPYSVTATPVRYNETGKLSFYADASGVRAQDAKGKPASFKSPAYEPK